MQLTCLCRAWTSRILASSPPWPPLTPRTSGRHDPSLPEWTFRLASRYREERNLVHFAERYCRPAQSRTPRAPNPVHIRFRNVRRLKLMTCDSSSMSIRARQYPLPPGRGSPRFEIVERGLAAGLRFVAVNGLGRNIHLVQSARNPVSSPLRTGKDQCRHDGRVLHQLIQLLLLIPGFQQVHRLLDPFGRRGDRRDFDFTGLCSKVWTSWVISAGIVAEKNSVCFCSAFWR